MFDYFYGAQAEQFSFYRVPKVLFTKEQFRQLSAEAKILYGIMLDKLDLSVKNKWGDDNGRVYIIYTIEQIMADMNCADQKATKLLDELEKKCGLIERRRQGLGKPNLIFVKNFITGVEGSVATQIQNREKHGSGAVNITTADYPKSRGINTNHNNTENNDINPIRSGCDGDEMDERNDYERYFRESLSIDVLLRENLGEEETILGILDLMVDVCCSKRSVIRIAGDDKPLAVVKSRFMKLNAEHIRYVLKCLSENTTKVRNIRQYLLTALYNAPATIRPFYQAWVNNDMATGQFYGGDQLMSKATVMAVVNQKGGTGKTTTCENLGIGLAREGKRVLLVDTDPQGSLTIALGHSRPDDLPVTLTDLMAKVMQDQPLAPKEGILPHEEGVELVPANITLSGLEVSLVNAMSRETVLKQYLETVKDSYDFILLDCMPSLGMLTVNALAASDRVLIPVQANYLSAKGLEQLLQTVNKVKRQINPKLRIEGILLTMVDYRTNFAKGISTLIRDTYGGRLKVYDADIPRSVRAAEISAEGVSIFKHDPGGKVAEAYQSLTKEVMANAEKRRKHQLDQLR